MNLFWQSHPALFIGVFVLLSSALALKPHPLYLFLLFLLIAPFAKKNAPRPLLLYAIFVAGLSYGLALWRTPPSLKTAVEGAGIFHIENLSITASPFNRSYCYRGVLKQFQSSDGSSFSQIPCTLFYPLKQAPPADCDYRIEGTLLQKKRDLFVLKPKKNSQWIPIEKTFSIAKWRFEAKQSVSSYIKRHISDPASSTFLSALITGTIDEKTLSLDFAHLGLQHLLAISGFHFSFFAWLCNLFLRPFFSFKSRTALLITALSAYFFFLGSAPSILRAFTSLSLLLCAAPLKRRAISLNLLGVALIIELLIDPFILTSLSFQLSFSCTLALLLYAPPMHLVCRFFFKERRRLELETMPLLDKHGYILGSLLCKTLAMNLAIYLFSLPLLLHLFHKFPLLSLFYNLFFPFCVFLSLILFCLALFCPPLHALNSIWTKALLQLTSHPPLYCDLILRYSLPFSTTILSLALLFYIGALFWERRKNFNILFDR